MIDNNKPNNFEKYYDGNIEKSCPGSEAPKKAILKILIEENQNNLTFQEMQNILDDCKLCLFGFIPSVK